MEAINSLVTTLFGLPVPVVAAVNGHALGGGLIVPLACDVLVATRAECKLGPDRGGRRRSLSRPRRSRCAGTACHRPSTTTCASPGACSARRRRLSLGVADELADARATWSRGRSRSRRGWPGYPAYARVKDQVRAAARAAIEQAVERDPLLTGWLSA